MRRSPQTGGTNRQSNGLPLTAASKQAASPPKNLGPLDVGAADRFGFALRVHVRFVSSHATRVLRGSPTTVERPVRTRSWPRPAGPRAGPSDRRRRPPPHRSEQRGCGDARRRPRARRVADRPPTNPARSQGGDRPARRASLDAGTGSAGAARHRWAIARVQRRFWVWHPTRPFIWRQRLLVPLSVA